jgi:predicted Rossmann fold flavoprotein
MKVAIIGGGASGFFTAINIKIENPSIEVVLFEKTQKLLSKVKVSGGGRCNVTNAERSFSEFTKSYPRGDKFFKKIYNFFKNEDIIAWFEDKGVQLKAEDDGRIFPVSDSSQTIIDCFLDLCDKYQIHIERGLACTEIKKVNDSLDLSFSNGQQEEFDRVVVCIGGGSSLPHYELIKNLKHHVHEPIPSLFTFNLVDKELTQLMGVAVKNALVRVNQTQNENVGDLLITHWGLSGPVVIKLSAFAAQKLHDIDYVYDVRVNWVNIKNDQLVKDHMTQFKKDNHLKFVVKNPLFDLPSRLWEHFCVKLEIPETLKWAETPAKTINRMAELLTNSTYKAKGKTTFKEEFVTCGGVDLNELEPESLESKLVPGVYFAGEVVNIDGVTGGFNFQNAWTTAFMVATSIAND